MSNIRNRIKSHRRVKARELVPHELNPRIHSEAQRDALKALYTEIGFARSLLAYELPDGRLKLIDGHLRQGMDPEMEVEVEILDVNDEEARKLLLSIDPLAQLASYNDAALDALRQTTQTDSDALANLWNSVNQAQQTVEANLKKTRRPVQPVEKFIVLIDCDNEKEQVTLLKRLRAEGLQCRALVS
jgi:hypothetical protein